MRIFSLLFVVTLFFSSFVWADIISEDNILEIEECYQFEDNELVRGKVVFSKGFVLPHNGVVTFDMDPEDSYVDGLVTMNNGCLVLKNNLNLEEVKFKGSGVIVNPSFNIWSKCELSDGVLSFLGNKACIMSETSGYFVINNDACLDVCDVADQVAFARVAIVGNGIKTALHGPQALLLSNVRWILKDNMVVNLDCQGIHVHGSNFITAVEGRAECVIANKLNFASSAELTIHPNTRLSVGYLKSVDTEWFLRLQDAQLRFLAGSGLPLLCNDSPGGRFIIRGISELKVKGNRFFIYKDNFSIDLEPYSEFRVNDMNKFKVLSRFVTPLRSCYEESRWI